MRIEIVAISTASREKIVDIARHVFPSIKNLRLLDLESSIDLSFFFCVEDLPRVNIVLVTILHVLPFDPRELAASNSPDLLAAIWIDTKLLSIVVSK